MKRHYPPEKYLSSWTQGVLVKLANQCRRRIISLKHCIFPSHCILCSTLTKRSLSICYTCENDLPWLQNPCNACALPLPPSKNSAPLCGNCLKQMPTFHKTVAAFIYSKPIDHLITQLKYQGNLVYAQVLGELLAQKLAAAYANHPKPSFIIPVPLYPTRLKKRGFNQALELARPISQKLNLPIHYTLCKQIKETRDQKGLSAKQRLSNIRGAFSVTTRSLKGQHIALIDDVVTTGYTVSELSRILRKAGASRVDVWCCARTPQGLI